jgi:hypothetical protein
MCKTGTDDPSFGKFLTLPEQKECFSCPPSNHTSIGTHLGAVSCTLARADDRSSARGALDLQVALANADDLNRVLDILGYRIRSERARGMRFRIV